MPSFMSARKRERGDELMFFTRLAVVYLRLTKLDSHDGKVNNK